MQDLEKDHRADTFSYNVEPLMPVSDPKKSERIACMQLARKKAAIIAKSGMVEEMTPQEIQKEIDAWRGERLESVIGLICIDPLYAEVKAAMSSHSTPSRTYYKKPPEPLSIRGF